MKAETSLKAGDPVKMRKNWIEDIPISPQVHNDVSAILAAEAKRFLMEKATPESLLAQLWEMGVRCDSCKYKVGETTAESGCRTFGQVLFCAHWDEEVV